MPGKDIDRVRARSALETVKEQPVIAAIAALPVVAGFVLVWWLLGFFPALLILLVVGGFIAWKGKLFG